MVNKRVAPNSREILERLVSFPTVSMTPNMELIDYVRQLFEAKGVSITVVEGRAGSNGNLFVSIGPDCDGGVMLSGHTDVVPVEGQTWSVPPFQLTERDGRFYGRGTADMKGFVACALRIALLSADRHLLAPLHLALSYDEEIGCVGVRDLIRVLGEKPVRPKLCIVGEPTSLSVATGHKGKIAARAICHGREVHSALAPKGLNAIHLAACFVQELQAIQRELERTGIHDEQYDIQYSTVHAGIIKGGTALNIVPSTCRVDFEVRYLQSDNPDRILSMIRSAADDISRSAGERDRIEIEVVNSYPGLDTAENDDAVSYVKSLLGANSTNKVAFGTEGGLFSRDLRIPTVVCGPGSMEQGHKPDEFIESSQIEKCDAMLDEVLNRISA